ncbi:MAG TPA: HAD family phosphatase [Ktedonobacteraceae bacterium]|nr:HAD family phosphatase [Ktedonobacteraceae bacterium]
MAIKAVIFDIGGVLLQSADQQQRGAWEERFGIQDSEVFKFINRSGLNAAATRGKVSSDELWQQVSEHFGIDREQIREVEKTYQSNERLNTELADFLKDLRPRYKTALLSNAWSGAREAVNKKYALDTLVDIQLFSAEDGTMKPEARFYLLALHRLGVQANETIFLDNKIINVDGASLVGLHSIHYQDNAQAIAAIHKYIERHA